MTVRHRGLLFATVLTATASSLIAAMPAVAVSPDANRAAIVFADNRSGNFELYTADSTGNELRQITADGAFNACPSWSPNRSQIAFCSDRSGTFQIYVMNVDGSGVRMIATGLGYNTFPAWSPDGSRLAFTGAVNSGDPGDVYTINVDGSGERDVTNNTADDAPQGATWNPADTELVFDSNLVGKYDLYTIRADGTRQRQITRGSGDNNSPAWSPDGTRIAYVHGGVDSAGNVVGQIYTINPYGRGVRQISSNTTTDDRNPAWSPGMGRMVFRRSDENGNTTLYFVGVASGVAQPLSIDKSSRQLAPDWAPR